jgi:hypothetical protein
MYAHEHTLGGSVSKAQAINKAWPAPELGPATAIMTAC